MLVREKCPECGARSTNSHDPAGGPKLLRCSCGHRWHVPRYVPEPKKRKEVSK